MAKLSNRELTTLLAAEKADSLGSRQNSTLTAARVKALNYYEGDVEDDLPNLEGRSTAVSFDVFDTVEGMMPSLMDVFTSSDEIVRFDPVGPEDVEAAQQETDYVNYVLMQLNHGFMVIYSGIKDALLSKTGITKVWWEDKDTEDRDTYYDQSEDVYALVSSDPDIEIVEHTEKDGPPSVDPQTGQPIPTVLHDFTVKSVRDESRCCIEPVPPEEFGITKRARMDLQSAHYLYHEPAGVTQQDLLNQGYDFDQIDGLATYTMAETSGSQEAFARDTVAENSQVGDDTSQNRSMRVIRVTEHYVQMDYEGDGTARRYRVVTAGEGTEVLEREGKPDIEEVDFWPFATGTPVPTTHRFFGSSIADAVMDIQRIKTALTRGFLDNLYLTMNPRIGVAESHSTPETLDDLMTWRQGQPIRMSQPGGLEPVVIPDVTGSIFPALQYFDSLREWRTGVSRQGQGLDADALNNQTATAAMQLYNASQARMKLVARILAETYMCDLMWLVHSTVRKYGSQSQTVKLRNQWVTVDPREWKERKDMTIDVGLGSGGKAEQMMQATTILQMQQQALQSPLAMLVSPKNYYNAVSDYCKLAGRKDVDRFFADPGDQPMPETPPDPKVMALQMQSQLDQQKMQMQAQLDQAQLQHKAQIETVQAQADIATNERKTEAEIMQNAQEFQFKKELALLDHELKMRESAVKIQQAEKKGEQAQQKGKGPTVIFSDGNKTLDGISGQLADAMGSHTEMITNAVGSMKDAMANHAKAVSAPKKVRKVKAKDGSTEFIQENM